MPSTFSVVAIQCGAYTLSIVPHYYAVGFAWQSHLYPYCCATCRHRDAHVQKALAVGWQRDTKDLSARLDSTIARNSELQGKINELERQLDHQRGEQVKQTSAMLQAATNLKLLLEAKDQELQKTQLQVGFLRYILPCKREVRKGIPFLVQLWR